VALAGCGGQGGATSAQPTRKPAPKLHVQLTGQSHQPRVGKRWSYEVRVTDAARKPVAADVHLQILFGGVPVGQVGRHHVRNGIWRETFGVPGNPPFPERARGQPLVLQAVVTALGETRKANYWIRVR
jgi:ribosomal protein S30